MLTKQEIARRHKLAEAVMRQEAARAGMSPREFLSPTRRPAIAHPRQDAMARAAERGLGCRVIAAAFQRDPATVTYAIQQSRQRAQEAR